MLHFHACFWLLGLGMHSLRALHEPLPQTTCMRGCLRALQHCLLLRKLLALCCMNGEVDGRQPRTELGPPAARGLLLCVLATLQKVTNTVKNTFILDNFFSGSSSQRLPDAFIPCAQSCSYWEHPFCSHNLKHFEVSGSRRRDCMRRITALNSFYTAASVAVL